MRNLRFATEADAKALLEIYAPYVSDTAITFDTEMPSLEDFSQRMLEIGEIFPYLVAEVDGKIAGYAYAHHFRERAAYHWTVELSIYLSNAFHGQGLGKALYVSLLDILKIQGVHMAYGCITLPNPASIALHEKLGFENAGVWRDAGWKHGKWHEVIWLQKQLNDGEGEPAPLKPIGEIDISAIAAAFSKG